MEVKPDRTVFNVEGTINSAGDNAIGLLRKAPGVLVDNNNNISVLSRSGVLLYVDGKRLPLTGDDLTNYLENLPAEQIDRIEIITNPGAKYEAEGNAGIIDIRLKKNKNFGANGTVNSTFSQGQLSTGNIGLSGNYRNSKLNTFGNIGYNAGRRFHEMDFDNFQNGLFLKETNYMENGFSAGNVRWGTDFFIGKNHTIGFLMSGQLSTRDGESENQVSIFPGQNVITKDSILAAQNLSDGERDQATFNLNYVYDNGKSTVNIDADYGQYNRDNTTFQPNQYFAADGNTPLTRIETRYVTPVNIDIYNFKVDVEKPLSGGKIGFGTKFTKVATKNTFLFYDVLNSNDVLNDRRSNRFDYDEDVYAAYVSYSRPLSKKLNLSSGLRLEVTDAMGSLQAFITELQEPPVELNYTNLFPTLGFTYAASQKHMFSLNYGRRINRPDYNVLNPFREQQSELSFSKGNPFLKPEIVNNVELGYTLNYRYNFKLSYSVTTDQITRLIAPDDSDPRASFINWDNLAEQTNIGLNISAPVQIKSWWNAFANFSAGYVDNQADYGGDAVVDIQAWTYNIYQQHTFTLPKGWTGEISGWFSGPGVWGGVFEYDESYSLNLGLQRKFFDNKMNMRLSASDITYQTGWTGSSTFAGLTGTGRGNWDSRRVSLSLSYNFGNNRVKSRKRSTGIEKESNRVGN
jgi:outer membrane receptor protein involved in Fe transport